MLGLLNLFDGASITMPAGAGDAAAAADTATQAATQAAQQGGLFGGGSGGTLIMVGYIIILVGVFYFFAIRPQKKRAAELKTMQDSIKVGDDVMTSSGFYGTVVDIDDKRVTVEFGASGSKSVRIPVSKSEIYGTNGQTTESATK